MMNRQQRYTTAAADFLDSNGICVGAAAGAILRGDRPSLPVAVEDERFVLAADIQIDNRAALADELRIDARDLSGLSDSALLLLLWNKREDGALDRLVGDFAIAVWDRNLRRLVLARDPSGQRPLFTSLSGKRLAFASMPSGLVAHRAINQGFDPTGFASKLSDELGQTSTYFTGVERLQPGHCAFYSNGRLDVRRWWNPSFDRHELGIDEAVDRYRSLLDQAVRARTGYDQQVVACQLSAGWDSSAVTATASRVADRPVVAFTSAPAKGFAGPVPRGRLADESEIAAATAKYCGIDHHVLRQSPLTLKFLEQQAQDFQEPSRNLINAVWDRDIQTMTAKMGGKVLLNALLGNLTLHFGGLPVLRLWLGGGHPATWLDQARAVARRGDVSWRGILFNSFDPLLPAALSRNLRRIGLGTDRWTGWFLNEDLRAQRRASIDDRAAWNPNVDRVKLITNLDHGMLGKGALASTGILPSDPLSDRRIMEFSLRLPPEMMLDKGVYRPLARRALADRLPVEMFDSPLRGVQSADWQTRFPRSEAVRIFDAIRGDPNVSEFLDLKRIKSCLDRWPTTDAGVLDGWELYGRMLPIALATGVFIKTFQSGVTELSACPT
ncbi:MAG: asparagine synthase-related protein [Pseudomonadota bacterium]